MGAAFWQARCHNFIDIIGRQEGIIMLIGYARTSTTEQVNGLEAQRESLKAIGCDRLYDEQTSATGPRKVLSEALGYVREGDVLVVTKLDRLARSVVHLGEIVAGLEARSVGLRILDLGLDTTTATGKLMLNVLGSVAQFEREMMLERQRDGIAKAKAQGKYKGRKPTAQAKKVEVVAMLAEGRSKRDVARALGISERSVYRVA
jgi:DNA invertase Pin-like site-specific DNA recombinase